MSDKEVSLESPTAMDHKQDREMHHHEAQEVGFEEEAVGTIVINENETGRAALRPIPSQDPNDPLVSPGGCLFN